MRTINEIIVHCTATPEGRPVTVAEIDQWHRARGWSGIGYHRVVGLNGERQDGRPIEKIGAHVAGHNTGTIGIVYVGGVEKDGKTPKDTRTAAQKDALLSEIVNLRDHFKIKKISGHNEYANKACPSFDASAEYDHLMMRAGDFVPTVDAVLQRGDSGAEVAAWVDDLAAYREQVDHPFPVRPGSAFDHTIEMVTIWFQKERGIVADGKVGPQTRDEMELALSGKPPFQAIPDAGPGPDTAEAARLLRAALEILT
ncbi:peptidoglycan recognition protein family protein [Pararhizobium haloflavum]|uniref:peptidoglycan recognition protein family protein n=1 Tax=Pararhizobium haloflavum TaxID=2037914 RepID=UPI000C19A65B|nr:N-acetylmuramoyl-L-alanine amidase [Pararhizobium haloflavum]